MEGSIIVAPGGDSEFELIRRMTRSVACFSDQLLTGIGDDCAVVAGGAEADLLLTADLLVEGVHFDRKWFSLRQIGSKAVRVNVSDIAAMGGVPDFALVTLAIPPDVSAASLEELYAGIREAAETFRVTIAGGDLSRSPDVLVLDVMVLGTTERGRAVLRSGARVGDRIFVSGTLGAAALGLLAARTQQRGPDAESAMARQCRPEPGIGLGRALSQGRLATAMIDLSDGLSSDLAHICEASGVGAKIRLQDLPVSDSCRRLAAAMAAEPFDFVLHGGEDYALLFTAGPDAVAVFGSRRFPFTVTEIGEILSPDAGIVLEYPDGRCEALRPSGYDHFR